MNAHLKNYVLTTFFILLMVVSSGEEVFCISKPSVYGQIDPDASGIIVNEPFAILSCLHRIPERLPTMFAETTLDLIDFNYNDDGPFSIQKHQQSEAEPENLKDDHGAIIRFSTKTKTIYLVFTADVYFEGGDQIFYVMERKGIKGSFFFTGNFLRERSNYQFIRKIKKAGHYIGIHSDQHLLYCDWDNRDSLLITKDEFETDILNNFKELKRFGVLPQQAPYFIPPYEWYNKTIVNWGNELGLKTVSFTPGTGTNADYTIPGMFNYKSSVKIYSGLLKFERDSEDGLNGAILLIHPGTSPERKDKFYRYLEDLIRHFSSKGYQFKSLK